MNRCLVTVLAALVGVGMGLSSRADGDSAAIEKEVARAESACWQRQAALKDRCRLTDYADRVRVVGGTNLWADALQAAIDAHEIVLIPPRSEPYLVERTVVVPSGRRIEAEGATVRLAEGMRTVLLRNAAAKDGTLRPIAPGTRDDNIAVVGGRWEDNSVFRRGYGRSGMFNLKTREVGNYFGVSTLFYFGNVDHVTVRDATFVRCGGFAIQSGDGEAHVYSDIRFDDCFADGIHLNGNLSRVHVRNVRGKVGDDLVALNAYDWLNSSVNFGPQRFILCEDLELILRDGKGYPAIRLQPAMFRYADGSKVDCSISDVIFRRVKGIRTFKMYLQTPRYEIGTVPEWAEVGSGGNLFFEDIDIDLTGPLDMLAGYVTSDPLRGHYGAFEFGANLSRVSFRNIRIRFHLDDYPLGHLATVGPKSAYFPPKDGRPGVEIFDPYVSCTVDTVVVDGLQAEGRRPERLVYPVTFDDINRDGRSTGRGVINNFIEGAAGAEQPEVIYDAEERPLEVSVVEGAWTVKVDCDLSAFGEVTVEFVEKVMPGTSFQVQLRNDWARESGTRGNGGAGIHQLMVWNVPKEGLDRITIPLPPDLPRFRACVERMKETRTWGLWARLWPNPCLSEVGAAGRKFLCCTLDPKRVTSVRVLRTGGKAAEMVSPGKGPAVAVKRVTAAGRPFVIPEQDLPRWAKMTPEEFFPFIDRYGQFKFCDWPGKILGDEDLARAIKDEDADLAAHPGPADRDRWGGWSKGPNFGSKGGWRTIRRDGKWWIVDPDGNLWWSHGPVRVSHSCGMTPYGGREDHFEFLPDNESPFAEFYRTRDELLWPYYVRFGCTNTYDFSAANLCRKYGTGWERTWGKRVHRRLRSWGANTIANSSDRKVTALGGTPYCDRFELKSRPIAETEKLMAWWPFRDPFDPSFRSDMRHRLQLHGRELKDPWCFGFFVDNELHWGGPGDLARWTWASPDGQPAKVEFVRRLRGKYGHVPAVPSDADFRDFSSAIVHAYFTAVRDEFKRVAPDKLYLGCRFSGAPEFVVRIAAVYCDVLSFNYYERDFSDFDGTMPTDIDKPVMIGEFHFGALDRGPFATGIIGVRDQAERAAAYEHYLTSALCNPRVVGVHWHQYADDVSTGRFDGENMQIGWTDVCDTPYPETIAAIRKIAERMYRLRDGAVKRSAR